MRDASDAVRALFRQWCESGISRVFNYVSYWVRDKHVAEDLTSAICERALDRLDQYDARRGSLDAWIFGIARNMVRNYFRGQSRRPQFIPLDDAPNLRSSAQSPEDVVADEEAFRRVIAHLRELSEAEREVVALRYGAGLTYAEIAEAMGITANYAGVILHRALGKLRQVLQRAEEV